MSEAKISVRGIPARFLARGAATLTVAFAAMLLCGVPAQAHPSLLRSDPVNGVTVAEPPAGVRLWFTEGLSPRVSTAQLVDDAGATVGGVRVVPTADPRLLELAVPRLRAGTYLVLWRVLTERDSHATAGTVVFSVGAVSRASVRPVGSSQAVDVALRWVRLCLLAGLVGALAVAGVLARVGGPGAVTSAARRRLLVLATGCAAVGVLAGQADLAVGVLRTPAAALFGATWGRLWLVREAALVVVATVLVTLVAGRGGRLRRVCVAVAWIATGAVVVAEAFDGHASGSAATAGAVHIAAACLWLGLLPALALLFARDTRPLVRTCLPHLTRLIVAGVGLLVVTGLYVAGRQVESAGDLTGTPYGRTLLVKAGLLTVLIGLGVVTATRRRVAAQAIVAAVLLLAVGVLAETPPGQGTAETVGTTRTGSVADLVVTISATPNLPGPNGFTVIVASERRPPPAPVDSARLEFASGGRTSVVVLREIGPQRYAATTRLDAPGPVEINAVVRRGGVPVRIPISWTLDRPSGSAHPLAPYADGLALGLVGAGMLAGAGHVLRRRRAAGAFR